MDYSEAARAIVKVCEGHGFFVQARDGRRYIITAARCLATLFPFASPASSSSRRCLVRVGPQNGEATISRKCLFLDPIGDVAVLGQPKEFDELASQEAYAAFAEAHQALKISKVPSDYAEAKLLTGQGVWSGCKIMSYRGPISIHRAHDGLTEKMAGTPILCEGNAVGVCVGPPEGSDGSTSGGPNPRLEHCLPGWLLRGCEDQPRDSAEVIGDPSLAI